MFASSRESHGLGSWLDSEAEMQLRSSSPARPKTILRRYGKRVGLTQCYEPRLRTASLNTSRVRMTILFCLAFAVLAISHVWLRFGIGDLKMQCSRLEEIRSDLTQRVSGLEYQNMQMCDTERLRDYARRELKMVEPAPNNRVAYALPERLKQKYYDASSMRQAGDGVPDLIMQEQNERGILQTLIDANHAVAATLDGK